MSTSSPSSGSSEHPTVQTRWEILETAPAVSASGTTSPAPAAAPAPEPIGLLYRRWDATELVTELIFARPEPHRIRSRIVFESKRWVTSYYAEDDQDPVTIEAKGLIEEEDAIPSYMEFLVLHDAASTFKDGDHTISYHVITPSDPHGIAQNASMWQPEAGMWEIETNGDLASTHWVEDGSVVRSDWRGYVSRLVQPAQAVRALSGVIDDGELAALLSHEPHHS